MSVKIILKAFYFQCFLAVIFFNASMARISDNDNVKNIDELTVRPGISDLLVQSSVSAERDTARYLVSNIGTDRIPSTTPFNFQWEHTLSQTLYLASEIGVSKGLLMGVEYEMTNSSVIPDTQIAIWVGETSRENLVMDWVDFFSLQKVFEKNTDFPAGENKIFIPFDTPYEYNGGNLVIHIHFSTNTLFGDSYFYTTEITTASRIKLSQRDNQPFDRSETDEIGRLMYNLPNIRFYFSPEGLQADKQLQPARQPAVSLRASRHSSSSGRATESVDRQTARDRQASGQRPTGSERINSSGTIHPARFAGRSIRGKYSLGVDISGNLYDGDYLNAMVMPEASIAFGFFRNRPLSLSIIAGAGRIESSDIFHTNFAHTGLGLTYRIFNSDPTGSPFAKLSGGVLYHTRGTRFEQVMSFDRNLSVFAKFSAGYEWLLNRNSVFRISLSNRQLFSDKIDGLEYGKYNDRIWSLDLGFVYYLNTGSGR